MPLRKISVPGRNQLCACGSRHKYKRCCGRVAVSRVDLSQFFTYFIDHDEQPVRWVIVDNTGTRLFADLAGRAIVFQSRADALTIAQLEDFADQDPGDINVAAVGPQKWQVLQANVPFVDVPDATTAAALVRERIAYQRQQLLADN